jgi:uncharacterized glyoxalase superfamily protein PhnB
MADLFLRTITVMPVKNIADAVRWYQKALGFEAIYLHEGDDETEETNYAVLERGNLHVHLILDEPPPHRRPWTIAGTGYLYLVVRDVEQVFAEVRSSGVEIARGLETEIWGARGFNLLDSSGNSIHVEAMM